MAILHLAKRLYLDLSILLYLIFLCLTSFYPAALQRFPRRASIRDWQRQGTNKGLNTLKKRSSQLFSEKGCLNSRFHTNR